MKAIDRKSARWRTLLFAGLFVNWVGLGARGDAADVRDFDATVAPLLIRRCLDCHMGSEAKGKLDLSRRASALEGGESGPAIVPGSLDESLLWEKVELDEMPPKHPLPAEEKAVLRAWIESGARWGGDPIDPYGATTDRRAGRDWWAFQPLSQPAWPAVRDASWSANPIDRFILGHLEARGLQPASRADRRTLIRRVTFDLIGLPPTPEEVAAFEADDRADAYERLVDRLLASPEYGARWARLWLDLARYGESNGFEHDEFRPHAWPYRDWVIRSFNEDMPYDEFMRFQIAGDVLRPDDPEAIEATGFLVAGAYDSVGQTQQSEAMRRVVRQDELEDIVGTVGQTFLGLTIQCARCHDHKFDPIRQAEYYRLCAALGGVRHGERDLSAIDPEIQAARRRLDDLIVMRDRIEGPARLAILGASRGGGAVRPPDPIARWDFDRGLEDRVGGLHGTLSGGARLSSEGLVVDGSSGFVLTLPLATDLRAKTLEAWVRLDNLSQAGGAVVSVQTTGGGAFDAIVFAEREPGQWMAGSEGFARTRSFQGPKETEANQRAVQVAIAYDADGTIRAYRDGAPYGRPYESDGPKTFPAGRSEVLFGLRHGRPGGNRMLSGRILRAQIYDRALSAEEVAASARTGGAFVTPEEIAEALPPEPRAEHARLLAEIASLRERLAGWSRRAYAVSPRPSEPTRRLIRGNPATPGELVSAGGVEAITGLSADFGLAADAPDSERRIKLANWLSDPNNPLPARVIVNRLWQAHFGVGLVETPSDFGFNGGRPSHPELLDWLASELLRRGWSLKRMQRLMVTSSTYQQSSRLNAEAMRGDASNRWLWRKSPTRLDAEMVRDAMLAVSGALNPVAGGPGFREFAVSQAVGTTTNRYTAVAASGPEFDRRTIYRAWARGGRNGFLDAFDCPDPSTVAPRRAVTTTPLQALTLLNNALTLRLAERFAERLRREAGDDPERQVVRAYQLAFGRFPDEVEREQAKRVVERFGPAVLARAIFNSNEFLYID